MLKKLLVATLFVVLGISSVSAQYNNAQINYLKNLQYKITSIEDAQIGVRVDGKTNNFGLPNIAGFMQALRESRPMQTDAWGMSSTFKDLGISTIYDLCSNGSTVQIWQNPTNANEIHIAVVFAPAGDPTTFPGRRTKYFFSSDKGVTWTNMGDVPSVRSGFPSINGFSSDGSALIFNHTNSGTPQQIAHAYKDAANGVGIFTELIPPLNNATSNALEPIWPRGAVISNTLANKFIMLASYSSSAAETDSSYYILNKSYTSSPGTWGTWQYFNSDQAETYATAVGSDGRIGVAYKNNDSKTVSDYADVWFMESTNNGVSFSTPIKIFNANFSGDSLGMLRGISMVYQGTSPKVVFETIKQTEAGSFFPGAPAKIRFWSPSLPGSDPNKSIVIGDTTMIGWHPYIGVNDVMSTLCRPNIGVSADGQLLMATFHAPSDFVGGITDTTTFMDVYITYSANNGASWKKPQKVNPESPVKDWRYASISPVNDNDAGNYYANISILKGNMPGSYVNGTGNGESQEPYNYIRVTIPKPVGINQVSTEVPNQFSLNQNYPNPFNPTTNINFAVSKPGLVTLKVYNTLGKEVAEIVNENLGVGSYNVKFDGSSLSSGLYFYTIKANGFTDTKKMMLIK